MGGDGVPWREWVDGRAGCVGRKAGRAVAGRYQRALANTVLREPSVVAGGRVVMRKWLLCAMRRKDANL